jgi:hypothetical protein
MASRHDSESVLKPYRNRGDRHLDRQFFITNMCFPNTMAAQEYGNIGPRVDWCAPAIMADVPLFNGRQNRCAPVPGGRPASADDETHEANRARQSAAGCGDGLPYRNS